MDTAQLNNEFSPKCATLVQVAFLEKLHELNLLHADMSRENGQAMARLDEIETVLEVKLNQVKQIRSRVREKQKHMRRVETKCSELLQQILVN